MRCYGRDSVVFESDGRKSVVSVTWCKSVAVERRRTHAGVFNEFLSQSMQVFRADGPPAVNAGEGRISIYPKKRSVHQAENHQ